MPKNLTDAPQWEPAISVPVDSDPANAASVETSFQLLANRTAWQKQTFEEYIDPGTGDFVYPGLLIRTVELDPMGMVGPEWDFFSGAAHRESKTGARERLYCPLAGIVPSGAALVSVQALVKPAVARAALNAMRLSLSAIESDWGAPATAQTTTTEVADDNGTTDWQMLQILPSGGPFTDVDHAARRYFLRIAAGSGTAGDRVSALRIGFTDPGPRNF